MVTVCGLVTIRLTISATLWVTIRAANRGTIRATTSRRVTHLPNNCMSAAGSITKLGRLACTWNSAAEGRTSPRIGLTRKPVDRFFPLQWFLSGLLQGPLQGLP